MLSELFSPKEAREMLVVTIVCLTTLLLGFAFLIVMVGVNAYRQASYDSGWKQLAGLRTPVTVEQGTRQTRWEARGLSALCLSLSPQDLAGNAAVRLLTPDGRVLNGANITRLQVGAVPPATGTRARFDRWVAAPDCEALKSRLALAQVSRKEAPAATPAGRQERPAGQAALRHTTFSAQPSAEMQQAFDRAMRQR